MSDQFSYTTYGAKVNASAVRTLLDHALDSLMNNPELPVPVCIWGRHGIGKTELVRELAHDRGFKFVYIAPAQFEEMGDLLGMPQIGTSEAQHQVTRFVPPDWVPREEGPGILLIDDVNRADDRILRGIMQLLQFYELVAWKLPARWQIVLTANPDGGDYSVTPLDEAMLTRMLHVTMQFEVKAWAQWAERAGIDSRGINFVLAYPELVSGHRTTPRSLVQFFQSIQSIHNLNEALPLVRMLGDACLDEATTQAFINFVHLRLDALPSPEEILWTEDYPGLEDRLRRRLSEGESIRLDMLSVLITRMTNYLKQREKPISEEAFGNLNQFIMMDLLPNDLRLSMAQELTATGKPWLRKLYSIPEIGKLLLEKM